MKSILITLTILSIAFIGLSCKHTKYTADKLPEKQLRWGNGGGFVGKESAHILCENGQIFSRDVMGKTTEADKTKGKKAKAVFKAAQETGLSKMEFNHPANIYNFIEIQEGDMVSRVVWGDKSYPVDKSVESLFVTLNGLIKK